MRYTIIDASNLMHRARWAISRDMSVEDVIGMSMDIFFRSMRKTFEKFNSEHAVIAFDDFSWRKVVFEDYKANRDEETDPRKILLKEEVRKSIDQMLVFFEQETNVTVLKRKLLEGDDFIARWIDLHPDDNHIIISTDSDFVQLLAPNVEIYNGVSSTLMNTTGIYYQDGFPVSKSVPHAELYSERWKIKSTNLHDVDPVWGLFQKIMLGDKSDNIPRAAPAGIGPKRLKAIFDSEEKLFEMLSSPRKDLPGEPLVQEIYARNNELINLRAQPDDIIDLLDSSIEESISREKREGVGMNFYNFCKINRLNRILKEANHFSKMLNRPY